MSTFVAVGNARQPFGRLLDGVAKCAHELPQPILIQNGHTPFVSDICECHEFFEMTEFQRSVEDAEVVIMQAGVGGILTAVQAGKIPVIVPRKSSQGEHVDDHQLEFGREVARSGRVILVENIADLAAAVDCALDRQRLGLQGTIEPELVQLVASSIDELALRIK